MVRRRLFEDIGDERTEGLTRERFSMFKTMVISRFTELAPQLKLQTTLV